MHNPFSSRTTISSGDYIQKKRILTKITFLKNMPYRNFKTSTYMVQDITPKEPDYEQPEYPEEPEFPPLPISLQTSDLFDYMGEEEYGKGGIIHNSDSSISKAVCKKCSNSLTRMNPTPKHWICDGWDPPNSYCESGNGKKFTNADVAYCCPNYRYCNWVICDKCYTSLLKRALDDEKKERDGVENALQNNVDFEDPDKGRTIKERELEKLLEEEKENAVRKNLTYAPIIKNIKSYKEYLDLTRGFYLTQPYCENAYPDCCELGGKRPVNNIFEARNSVLDYGKECLYEREEVGQGVGENEDGTRNEPGIRYNNPILNRERLERGILNLRGVIDTKYETEQYMQFPKTLKKTQFCDQPIGKDPKEEHHKINPNMRHTHWFPTKNRFVKFGHHHNDIPHKENIDGTERGAGYPSHPGSKYSFRFGITERGRKTVKLVGPTKNRANIEYNKIIRPTKHPSFSFQFKR
jgi:hypothetical protein